MTQHISHLVTGSLIRQKKLSVVFECARGCQGMVLQLVFDPLAYLQYSALPDHRPGPAAFYQSPGAKHLVPGLVAEDHAEHHVHGGCVVVSRWSAPLLFMGSRTYRRW